MVKVKPVMWPILVASLVALCAADSAEVRYRVGAPVLGVRTH